MDTGCADIDECMNPGICPNNSHCKNTAGNFSCQCSPGFQGNSCRDIDECADVNSCHSNATCFNVDGSYSCSCKLGYRGNGKVCDIGQCDDRRCPFNQKCILPTTNDCECKEGFKFDDVVDLCQDIDECFFDHECDPNSLCLNSEGTYTCLCETGYVGDGRTCVEPCRDSDCSMNEECISPTKSDCRCKKGFERNQTDFCVDIDECFTMIRHFHTPSKRHELKSSM